MECAPDRLVDIIVTPFRVGNRPNRVGLEQADDRGPLREPASKLRSDIAPRLIDLDRDIRVAVGIAVGCTGKLRELVTAILIFFDQFGAELT